jgi:sec-independent protein translocase protein TatA
MGNLGLPEIAFIFVLALLIFGPKRLPEIGRTLGKAMGEFRRASNELKRTINTELALDEDLTSPSATKHARRVPAGTLPGPHPVASVPSVAAAAPPPAEALSPDEEPPAHDAIETAEAS